MTRRERVIKAVNHIETDIVPYNINLTHQEYEKVASYLGDPHFLKKIGNHIDSAYYDGYPTEISPGSGYWKDDFGVIWNRNGVDKDIGVIDNILIREPSVDSYKFPPINEERIRREYERLMNNGEDTFKFGSIGFTLFERAWTLRGMENLLTDMVLESVFVEKLLEH